MTEERDLVSSLLRFKTTSASSVTFTTLIAGGRPVTNHRSLDFKETCNAFAPSDSGRVHLEGRARHKRHKRVAMPGTRHEQIAKPVVWYLGGLSPSGTVSTPAV